jgi:acetyltransferase-like isoleucine patch superfamily enzyme
MRGVVVERSCYLHPLISVGDLPHVRPSGAIEIGPACELSRGVELRPWGGSIRLGTRVFIGPYAVIYGHGGVEIGDHSLVSMHCCILSSNHTIASRDKVIRHEPDIRLATKIGRDCWLGSGVKVLGGVNIGDGCIVGAGAVVSNDLLPYSIAVGVPAKVIGQRP